MVTTTMKTRTAILNLDNLCHCKACMAALGMAMANLELLVVVTRDASRLPTLIKKAALVVEAHESIAVTAMRVTMAMNDLVLAENPQSDDLTHPDDITPCIRQMFAQHVGHG